MDELGNWVYIILMVVIGISSLFSSKNRKKGQQQTHIPVPAPGESAFPVPPVPMKKSKKTTPLDSAKFGQPFSSRTPSPFTASNIQTEISIEPEDEYVLADELDLKDAESFRKAILYAEILNRKY